MVVYLSWGERLLRARINWRHTVAVTLSIIGESNKIKIKLWWPHIKDRFNLQIYFTIISGL